MIALIDGDIVAYRCAASAEKENLDVAIWRTDDLIRRILHDTGSDKYEIYLSGHSNFRKTLFPEYKANRTQPRPRFLEQIRERVVLDWHGIVTDGYEADDGIGISNTNYWEQGIPTTICSIDKDLKQLAGKHYNFVKDERDYVTPLQGLRNFYRQLLIGDVADNIMGVVGIGVRKAPRYIPDDLEDEKEMYRVVQELYKDDARLELNCRLMWILRKENQEWNSPITREQEEGNQ